MRRARLALVATLAATLVLAGPAAGPGEASPCAGVRAAAGESRAGLVVQFSDLSVKEFCVAFTEGSITGFELLRRSGLPLRYKDYGGAGVFICKIGPDGCDYPTESCQCRCKSSVDCRFWGYYLIDRDTGAWRFSSVGASGREVRDGEVDGWKWGVHPLGGTNPPPPSTLEGICARGTRIGPPGSPPPGPRPTGGATRAPPTTTVAGAKHSPPAPAGTAVETGAPGSPTPAPGSTGTAAALPGARRTDGGANPPSPAGIALVVLAAGGLGAWGVLRARERRSPP